MDPCTPAIVQWHGNCIELTLLELESFWLGGKGNWQVIVTLVLGQTVTLAMWKRATLLS